MKKLIQKEIDICDSCSGDVSVLYTCNACKKTFCYQCNSNKDIGKTLPHSVWCSGGDDVYFCNPCIINPVPRTVAILAAYQQISLLRAESKAWNENFEGRSKQAESDVKAIVKKYSIK